MERRPGVQSLRSARDLPRPAPRGAAGAVFFRLQVLCNDRSRVQNEIALLRFRQQQLDQRIRDIAKEMSDLIRLLSRNGVATPPASDASRPECSPSGIGDLTIEY